MLPMLFYTVMVKHQSNNKTRIFLVEGDFNNVEAALMFALFGSKFTHCVQQLLVFCKRVESGASEDGFSKTMKWQ